MSDLIGILATDAARFTLFSVSLSKLEIPPDTTISWKLGCNIAANCNQLVREVLDDGHDWLWLLGDDHAFQSDLLLRLLDHDQDIIVPLCLKRWPPFQPVLFESDRNGDGSYIDLDCYDGGLIEVAAAGSGGMLIRRHVLEAMSSPWFESGRYEKDGMAEDLWFCDKARAKGFQIFCDLDAPLGHITSTVVWPKRHPDGWSFGLGFPEGVVISLPPGVFV